LSPRGDFFLVVLGDLEDEDLGGAEGVEGRTGVDMRQGRERRKKKFGCFGQMLLPTERRFFLVLTKNTE
jgi:hypothetical protein